MSSKIAIIYNTTYHWQVVAYNTTGNAQASESWSFTTQVAPPSAVSLSSPANSATDQVLRPTLTWQQPSGTVSGYRVYSSTIPNPTLSSGDGNLVATINSATTTSWTYTSDL